MEIVKVMGGLGNQLFQFAFGKSLELLYHRQVQYDLSYYQEIPKGDTQRKAYVQRFFPEDKIADQNSYLRMKEQDKKFGNRIKKIWGKYETVIVYESEDMMIDQMMDGRYWIGYWQSEHFFKEIALEIRRCIDFGKWEMDAFSKQTLKDIEKESYPVSIHVRAGDYLNPENDAVFGKICTSGYYEKAIGEIESRHSDATFFLFTNDLEWTKANISLPYERIRIVDTKNAKEDWVDLYLMSRCKGNIIANSSYSWWAAWLNPDDDKIVICPEKWTNNGSNAKIICDDWIKVSGES